MSEPIKNPELPNGVQVDVVHNNDTTITEVPIVKTETGGSRPPAPGATGPSPGPGIYPK